MNGIAQSLELVFNAIKAFFNSPAVSALSGAMIGGIIAYACGIRLARRQSFNEAARKFRAAFVEVQRLLDESKSFDITAPNGTRVKTILERHIAEHEKAMLTFRPYVSKRKLEGFNKAWRAYYSQENKYAECLSEYDPVPITSSVDNPKHEEQTRKLVLDRIDDLLNFAAPE